MDPPPYLPPRRPSSMPNLPKSQAAPQSLDVDDTAISASPPPFLPPRRASSLQLPGTPRAVHHSGSRTLRRPSSLQSIPDTEHDTSSTAAPQRSNSDRRRRLAKRQRHDGADCRPRDARLQAIQYGEQFGSTQSPHMPRRPPVLRHSSLRMESRVSEDAVQRVFRGHGMLGGTHSDPNLRSDQGRPHSHPMTKATSRPHDQIVHPLPARTGNVNAEPKVNDPYKLPPLSFDRSPLAPLELIPRPGASLSRMTSLDNVITYREERAEWKRASSVLQQGFSNAGRGPARNDDHMIRSIDEPRHSVTADEKSVISASITDTPPSPKQQSKFRHFAGEVGFCFTIAMTQFLAEYLISGFAVELPRIFNNRIYIGTSALDLFWPASLLSLILSAMLLIFARLSDMYGGYPCFMFGLVWLTIWTLTPGFCDSLIMVDVSRAMQGLAIAAFSPATFALIGSFYTDGPRKNIVLGLYSGCAPLGFFAGFLTAGALPEGKYQWYFWIASALSAVTAVTAFLTVPHDKTDRKTLGLKMDWLGAFLITSGLILVAYALAVVPYGTGFSTHKNAFSYPNVYGPFCSGVACLVLAVWVEGWLATCPLLPLDFFRPRSVTAFCLAGLCFYASYGVWLYNSSEYFQSTTGVAGADGITGIQLALWYTPTAIGGLMLCVVGGALLHIVPIEALLLLSGLAWIAAPLLLAVGPLPLDYWAVVVPSMLCATLGIDLTYTVSLVFLSAFQPQRYQGLCGAVCSILVNLAMSFSLPLSEIVTKRAQSADLDAVMSATSPAQSLALVNRAANWGYQSAFIYGAASAGLGFAICVLFVRIPRSVVGGQKVVDEERPRETSSEAPTLVDESRAPTPDEETPVQSAELER